MRRGHPDVNEHKVWIAAEMRRRGWSYNMIGRFFTKDKITVRNWLINSAPRVEQRSGQRLVAHRLRRSGMSYEKIGKAIGVSTGTAWTMINMEKTHEQAGNI